MAESISYTILEQLGGTKFIMMTGAKEFVFGRKSLAFELSSRGTKNKCNRVLITLDSTDTYTVRFWRYSSLKINDISSHKGIYFDQLRPLFTEQTGLYTSL